MKLLVIIDMQNDFITGSLGSELTQSIVPNVVKKVEEAEKNNISVLFTKDTHYKNYLQTLEGEKLPVEHCIKNTLGWEIIPQLEKFTTEEYDRTNMLLKTTFGSVNLPLLLKDVEEVELIGVCTDICVVSNALLIRAHYPNLKITVDSNCCAGTSVEAHNSALEVMKSCQIDVI